MILRVLGSMTVRGAGSLLGDVDRAGGDRNVERVGAWGANGNARRDPVTMGIDHSHLSRAENADVGRSAVRCDNAVRHAASTVTVTVRRERDEAVLEVQDDGPGIPPDQREAVFDRFTRLATARNKETKGTGRGLPIARGIATQHGGTLTIDDSEQGARFVMKIPLHEPEQLVTPPQTAAFDDGPVQ
jgi:hypothetical protein